MVKIQARGLSYQTPGSDTRVPSPESSSSDNDLSLCITSETYAAREPWSRIASTLRSLLLNTFKTWRKAIAS